MLTGCQLSILGKKNTKRKATTNWQKKTERAKKRGQQAIERTELEAAEKGAKMLKRKWSTHR